LAMEDEIFLKSVIIVERHDIHDWYIL